MKILLVVSMFLMSFVSLYSAENSVQLAQPDAYPKKIIFGTYSKQSSAKYDLYSFRKDALYKKLYDLAIKNNFMIHYRPLADYTILVMEPIHKRAVFFEALALIKQRYPRAYHLSAEGLEVDIKKPLPPLAQKSSQTAKKESCVTDKTSENVEKPIFKVEEVSDANMAVNCAPSTKKDSKKTQETKEEVKLKADNMLASNSVKQELADATQNKEVKEETTNIVQNQEVKKEVSQAVKPVQKINEQKNEQKEESLLDSILKYFTYSKEKIEVSKVKNEVKDVKKEQEVPALENNNKILPDDMDVPELDKFAGLSEEKAQDDLNIEKTEKEQQEPALNKSTSKSKTIENLQIQKTDFNDINTSNEADLLDVDNNSEDNAVAKNDANITQKSTDDGKNAELDSAKYKVKTVQEDNQTKIIKQTDVNKEMTQALKKEPPETQKKYFTFTNILIGLFIVFSPFLYRKFKKLKSIYNQY